MSQTHNHHATISASSHRFHHSKNCGVSRRNMHRHHDSLRQPSTSPSSDDNHHEKSPRQHGHQSFDKHQWFDSPHESSKFYSRKADDFTPLPFRHNAENAAASDCISICSDVAVVCGISSSASPINNRVNDHEDNAPSSSHGSSFRSSTDAMAQVIESLQDNNCLEEEEDQSDAEDPFDPTNMPAPVTDSLCRPKHHFPRISQPIALTNYTLGQEGRPIDMRVESSHRSAHLAVASLLRQFDAAFCRRSDGRWCYTILAEKIMVEGDNVECSKLRFVVDDSGSTKNFRFNKWAQCVRLIREPIEALALLAES